MDHKANRQGKHTYAYTCIQTYVYVYICTCVYVCVLLLQVFGVGAQFMKPIQSNGTANASREIIKNMPHTHTYVHIRSQTYQK